MSTFLWLLPAVLFRWYQLINLSAKANLNALTISVLNGQRGNRTHSGHKSPVLQTGVSTLALYLPKLLSPQTDSNRQPAHYKWAALPLSHEGNI